MSFVGDLEHLPIVDVIQLLHSTRKTGTLNLKSRKGESQLVFNEGYIVSANHVNNSVRIGQILVDMGALTLEGLESALKEQKNAGARRMPLIATLIESGVLPKEEAYKGLETLIEMTIVEVLSWTRGTFELDVNNTLISDEYRYFPEKLKQEIYLNTQSVLMDALRIYDEKMRDGTLADASFSADEAPGEAMFAAVQESPDISADVLGLADLDKLDKKIPDVFLGVKEYDPAESQRQKIRGEMRDIPPEEQERFFSFLKEFSETGHGGEGEATAVAAILFSQDEFITQAAMAVCQHGGFFVFTTDEEMNLDLIVEQTLTKGLAPVLVVDLPEKNQDGFSKENILALIRQKLGKYRQISILQLVAPQDYDFSLQALQAGVRAVIPRPGREEQPATFVTGTIEFLKAFHSYLKNSFTGPEQQLLRLFKENMLALGTHREAPEVSLLLLGFASAIFERTITFVVGKSELIAERGIGVTADKSAGATPPLKFRIPLAQPSVFQEVIEDGRLFYGHTNDTTLTSQLFAEIGPPHTSKVLLAPIKSLGRVIAITYGDFGPNASSPVPVDLLEILARHAGLVLDNALYRKKFEKPSQSP